MGSFKSITVGLTLFSLLPTTSLAQLSLMRQVPKEEALSIAQQQFPGQDVDYYLLDDNTSSAWNIFVDAEPMKGWQHNCFFVTYPKSATGGDVQFSCAIPTDAQHVAIDVPHLVSGVYVVSYSVNSTIIDQKKIKVE